MLLTIKDLSAWLNIKSSTLYLWAAQGKIPCRKIHGLIRFDREAIQQWLDTFGSHISPLPSIHSGSRGQDIGAVIARAKRSLYTAPREKPDEDRAKQGG
jgi:excisionase family DNA binding protein